MESLEFRFLCSLSVCCIVWGKVRNTVEARIIRVMKKIEISFLFAVLPSQSAADITRIALSSSLRIFLQLTFNLEKAVTEHISDVQSRTSHFQIIATPARANYPPSSSYKIDLSIEADLSSPEPAGTRTEQTAVDRLIWRFRASRELIIRHRYVEVLEYDSRVPNVKVMDHLRVVASTIW